jgi:hypothetical protein
MGMFSVNWEATTYVFDGALVNGLATGQIQMKT